MAGAAPTISSFSPTYGANTDPDIEILGSGFATGAGTTNIVKFGSYFSPSVFASSSTRLLVKVPGTAPVGSVVPISVIVSGSTFTTVSNFTVIGVGPYISGFTPASGGAGTLVDISGAHFVGSGETITVSFNGVVAPVTVETTTSDTLLHYKAPAGVTSGPITVTRSGATGGTWTSSALFYVTPAVTNFSPSFGRAGTNVVIRGINFTNATAVYFGAVSASFTSNTANQVVATVPANAITARVRVLTPATGYVESTSNFVVLPLITSFTPNVGRAGTNVTIYGENLWGATNVLFGGVKAAAPTGISYGQLTAVVPNGATNGYITVQTTNGSYTINQLFYLPPLVSSFTPTNAAAGSTVQIIGTNFLGATAVSFNDTPATSFVVTNNGVIGAVVPAGVITGPISVTTPYGTTNSGNALFYGAPIVSGFNPTHGLPETNVTVFGTNFTGTTAVKFNGTNASFSVINGILTAVVPTNASTGPISVTGPAGTTVSGASFVLDYASDIAVTVSAPTNVLLLNNFTYVITVTNKGPFAAPAVFLTNTLPGTVQFQFGGISPSAGRSFVSTAGNPIIANLGTIAVSNAVTVTLTVKPQVTGVINNTAFAIGGYDDPVPGNNTGSASTTIYVVPVLAIQMPSATQVQLSWAASLTDFMLQSSTNLSDTNAWSDVQTAPDYVGDQKVVTETIGSGVRFYRLRQ